MYALQKTDAKAAEPWVKKDNLVRLLLSVAIGLNLYILVGSVFTNGDFDIFDIGSTIVLTTVLYLVFLPGLFIHLFVLRWIGAANRGRSVRRVVAVITSPLVATVFFVLVAVSGDYASPVSSTWIAVLSVTTIFGMLVKLPAPRQAHHIGAGSMLAP